MDPDEAKMCRYCFGDEEEGPLISPCACLGGQKWVHLECMRRWQRMVLVSQPTHPAFYEEDERQYTCNVCLSKFTCTPPTRGELMESFTGPEIAALIDVDRILSFRDVVSDKMEEEYNSLPSFLRQSSGCDHWIRGVFLITEVSPDSGESFTIPVEDNDRLERLRNILGDDLQMDIQGRKYKLSPSSPSLVPILRDLMPPSPVPSSPSPSSPYSPSFPTPPSSPPPFSQPSPSESSSSSSSESPPPLELTKKAFNLLQVPCSIVLSPATPPTCSDDQITAISLTRRIASPRDAPETAKILQRVAKKYPGANKVKVIHFLGGPCEMESVMACVVTGGRGRGWTVVDNLYEAIVLAYARAKRRCEEQGDLGEGQTVKLQGLKARPDLNGQIGIALKFEPENGRWQVRLPNGEGVKVKPANIQGEEEGKWGTVSCVWGNARWTRVQLLGEIARGHWGLAVANVCDFTAPIEKRWEGTKGRVGFAPITDMTEDWMKESDAQKLMESYREGARMAATQGGGTE